MYKKIVTCLCILSVALLFSGCGDVFSPANENILGTKFMYGDASYAEGFLADAYNLLPNGSWTFSDVATDNAVSNDNTNSYRHMAIGQWTASNYPLSEWRPGKDAIQYLNIFLANADSVTWANDKAINKLFNQRMKGEAYGLRGLFMYYLLRAHAGWTGSNESGKLLGVPIILKPQTAQTPLSDFNKPRATFEACMQQIYSDLDKAIKLLPLDYGDLSDVSQVPSAYGDVGLTGYNRVFGNSGKQRMSGRIAMAIKAKAALLAASPAYQSPDNTTTWADAAKYTGEVLKLNGGVSGLAPDGATWYANSSVISSLASGANPPEILWRTNVGSSTSLESQNFPPTLFGNGRVDPTQNLVNAFPMQNGYPITDPNSGYDPSHPYENRDPLLLKYIVVNGSTEGVNSSTIITAADGNTNDALNKVATSTRTGYYMRKLLRQDVNLNPQTTNAQLHYKPRIRYTVLYLNYAEAANEAWGPLGTGSFGFSAYDVIAAIRKREGITQPDAYLESIKSDKVAMRKLIQNVRRIELCFEDHRFWDLRRWNEGMNEPAMGDMIENGNHKLITVEKRVYNKYMRFGPIPRDAVLKYSALKQNYGW